MRLAESPSARHLLPLLRDIAHAADMSLADWDATLRLARLARVLGIIAHRVHSQEPLWAVIPKPVQGHLRASINYSACRAQMLHAEIRALDSALPGGLPVVLLKGAAYLLQGLPNARGRNPNDVDLLVCRTDLAAAETALTDAGWVSEVRDDYDERYYREWSHELPPMRFPGHPLEVDLHHTIAPVTSRTRADDDLLFEGLVALPDSRFQVLHPLDQIIHAAVHLFQDSELDGRLRDLVDLDGLIRHNVRFEEGWSQLRNRAERHRALRVLWYALHYCRSWLGTPIPDTAFPAAPPDPLRRTMDWMFSRTSLPRLPEDTRGADLSMAFSLGRLRYHRLRMPPALLARHLAYKTWASLATRRSASRK